MSATANIAGRFVERDINHWFCLVVERLAVDGNVVAGYEASSEVRDFPVHKHSAFFDQIVNLSAADRKSAGNVFVEPYIAGR